jgi:hypothetical protein
MKGAIMPYSQCIDKEDVFRDLSANELLRVSGGMSDDDEFDDDDGGDGGDDGGDSESGDSGGGGNGSSGGSSGGYTPYSSTPPSGTTSTPAPASQNPPGFQCTQVTIPATANSPGGKELVCVATPPAGKNKNSIFNLACNDIYCRPFIYSIAIILYISE